MQLDPSTTPPSTQASTRTETQYVYPSFVPYTARTLLGPVTAGALQAGIGCAGMELWQNSACDPLRVFVHPDHVEQSTSIARITAASAFIYDVRSVGSTMSSTAAAPSSAGFSFGTKKSA